MSLLTQNIIVGIIILAAIAWIVVKLIRARKKSSAGCCGCSMSASCPHLGEATSPKSPCGCPHCAADKESAEICCSVRCPEGNGAVSPKINPHENNQNLE